jgi:hypothetical protein
MTPMGQFINEMRDLAEPKREGLRDGANGGSADSEEGEKRGADHVARAVRASSELPRIVGSAASSRITSPARPLPVRRVAHSEVETAPECTTHPTPPSSVKTHPLPPQCIKRGERCTKRP